MNLLDRYEELKKKITERQEPFAIFIELLEKETTWLNSPASTQYHLAEDQGLLRHSVGVTETFCVSVKRDH